MINPKTRLPNNLGWANKTHLIRVIKRKVIQLIEWAEKAQKWRPQTAHQHEKLIVFFMFVRFAEMFFDSNYLKIRFCFIFLSVCLLFLLLLPNFSFRKNNSYRVCFAKLILFVYMCVVIDSTHTIDTNSKKANKQN